MRKQETGYAQAKPGEHTYKMLEAEQAIDGKLFKAGDTVKLDPKTAALMQSRGVRLAEVSKPTEA